MTIIATIFGPTNVETDKREMEVNKQENGYECGMHVLEIAYQLIDTKFYSSGMFETETLSRQAEFVHSADSPVKITWFPTKKVDDWQPECVNVSQCRLRLKSAIARLAKESTPVS